MRAVYLSANQRRQTIIPLPLASLHPRASGAALFVSDGSVVLFYGSLDAAASSKRLLTYAVFEDAATERVD